ncbi:hypothetical protein RchiOBHm_Chr2g0148141 [Rosa chinensis]|uniref:K+-H+ exchange-like protein n=1 Tax=Rosa chinensis TaxID=74649 RepID=A0A2P6RZC1_ROSCH|nr:uncharacterized protein C23H3.12c [Rosa chinensis]PRQ51772.1 hypothetical protein RchiOBHm_Chr2g0148141 [Rosa chinensis]
MRARLIVFPVKGRNWCFSRSIDPLVSDSSYGNTPSTLKDLWKRISFNSNPNVNSSSNANATVNPFAANAELVVDFISNKMNKAWISLEKAPEGTFKRKIHGVGLKLLARVKPSEIFLKSITNEVSHVEVTYPSSLNARLVRRRLRHIASRGSIIHKKYLYGSVTLLPLTSAFMVLPLPNIPFFWCLFRTYSHWRALQGSEKLLQLVSDRPKTPDGNGVEHGTKKLLNSPWVLQPSKELEELLHQGDEHDGLNKQAILKVCKAFDLNSNDVLKYRDTV